MSTIRDRNAERRISSGRFLETDSGDLRCQVILSAFAKHFDRAAKSIVIGAPLLLCETRSAFLHPRGPVRLDCVMVSLVARD
jgi:hypothetical protein